jgi:phosphinothricin acetyltransferase
MKTPPKIRRASESDLPVILAIYNDAVENTTAIWNETPADLANRRAWFAERTGKGFPVLVAERQVSNDQGVIGYGSFGDFRPFEGYRVTVEHSVYVAKEARGQGAGEALLQALIDEAARMDKHNMIGGIDASNAPSIALHVKFGFEEVGRMPGVGTKFGKPLDLLLMQKVL